MPDRFIKAERIRRQIQFGVMTISCAAAHLGRALSIL
jgi:hypothetical protein